MRTLLIIFIGFLYVISCNHHTGRNLIESTDKMEFIILKIDSTENSYFLDCKLIKDDKEFVLVSPKVESNNCREIITGREYKMSVDFQSFMAGDYGDYVIDGKEFPLETVIAFTNELKGLCHR